MKNRGTAGEHGPRYWFWGRDRLGLPWHLYLTENLGGIAPLDAACGYQSPRTHDRQGEVPLPRSTLCQRCIDGMPPTIARITAL
jgi:hypothetical protein